MYTVPEMMKLFAVKALINAFICTSGDAFRQFITVMQEIGHKVRGFIIDGISADRYN